jgi:DNA-binding MarR family transcriptional regulator
MDLGQRKMTKREPQISAELNFQPLDLTVRPPRIGTFVIAVLEDQMGPAWPAKVVYRLVQRLDFRLSSLRHKRPSSPSARKYVKSSIAYQCVKTSRIRYDLAQAAYTVHTALEHALHDTLAELDLTVALADVLWQLDPELGPQSRRQLAERLHCDPSNVTFLVSRLQRRRFVASAPVKTDRRVKALALTDAGAQARNRLIATLAESAIFAGLTRAEQRQLAELLRRCADGSRVGAIAGQKPS